MDTTTYPGINVRECRLAARKATRPSLAYPERPVVTEKLVFGNTGNAPVDTMTTTDNDESVTSDQRDTGDAQAADQLTTDYDGPGELLAGPDPRIDTARNSHAAVNNALLRQAEREAEAEEDDGDER